MCSSDLIRSQQRAGAAIASGYFAEEIIPVQVPGGKAGPITVDKDEHPRPETTLEGLAKLKPIVRNPGTVTAGNASGVNDGAAAMILASEVAVKRHGLTPRAKILGLASAAVPPRIMGIGPVPATRKLVERLGIKVSDFDLIELNEAFASQGIACLRQLGVKEDADFVNPHGGAIALGHPLGMSGARLVLTISAVCFIRARSSALTMPRVASTSRMCSDSTSQRVKKSALLAAVS